MTPLTTGTVAELTIPIPGYDRSAVTAGIVHFGVGGFHRAHQAMYLDLLMEQGKALDWGICGIGVMPSDARMRDIMDEQNCLYTLVLKDNDGTWEPRVIGSIVEYLFAPDAPEAVIEKMADPAIRIVSLTVTEGGYNLHPVTGEFDAANPAVAGRSGAGSDAAHHLRADHRGAGPAAGARGAAVHCHVVRQHPGQRARGAQDVQRFRAAAAIRSWPPGWRQRAVPELHGRPDHPGHHRRRPRADLRPVRCRRQWPVVCEPFTQWVLEDTFTAGRPPYEDVGVQVVPDVEPYELMKLRLLNASHQALCYFGYLAGYRLVHDVARDPLFAEFLLGYMHDEAEPTLAPVPGIDLHGYMDQLIERFSNGGVRDTVARLCADSSDRIPKWLLPVVRENLAAGRDVSMAAAVVASWARYSEGTDEQGEPITVVDRMADELRAIAGRQGADPTAFIANRELFGDLVDEPGFVDPYLRTLESLHAVGSRETLRALMSSRVV